MFRLLLASLIVVSNAAAWGQPAPGGAAPSAERGAYVFAIAGCAHCHLDPANRQAIGAGGTALNTPFGVFYGPNITSHPERGIGRWTEAQFLRALRDGVRPDGAYYFPVFPYTAFTRMTDGDMRDLFAYVRSLPPIDRASTPHQVGFPFNIRLLQFFWRMLYFTRGPFGADPGRSAEVNRGAYLSEAMAHCQECHTPRNFLGGLRASMAYAGTPDGPDGRPVPNITPDQPTGIGRWSAEDLATVLESGFTPEGDTLGRDMAPVVANGTSRLTGADRRAMVAYLRSLRPIESGPRW